MPSIAPPRFSWLDLPCTKWKPDIRAFNIYVPSSENGFNDALPLLGTTWGLCPSWIKTVQAIPPTLQDYVLRDHAASGDGGRVFIFGPVLTTQQKTTPFRPAYHNRRQQYWPTVLLKLWFEKHQINGQDVILERMLHRDGQTYSTVFETLEYITDVQRSKTQLSRLQQITDSIHWNLGSNSGSVPECLHGDVSFQNFTASGSGSVLFGCGTVESGIAGQQSKQEFPATPMTDWERYPVEIQSNYVMGYWHYIETWAIPPIDGREDMS
jgi:hypothetical protein